MLVHQRVTDFHGHWWIFHHENCRSVSRSKTGELSILNGDLPGLVNIQKAIEHGNRNSGFIHEKWWIFP